MKLTRIKIKNFKAIRDLDSEIGYRTTISGANATGKSTILDAFLWCLFAKDAKDRPDNGRGAFGLKTLDESGKVIDKIDHEVTIWLQGDNMPPMELTRRLSENWVKHRGDIEPRFEGNTTTCVWNGAEMGVNEFNKRVEEHLIPIRLFKMVTNPHYFSSLPWAEQLQELTRMIGNVTYEEVAKGNKAFEAALAHVGETNTLKDRVTTLATERKRLKERLDEIPSEIRGLKDGTPEEPDYAELEAERNGFLEEQENIDAAQRSAADAERVRYDEITKKQQRINELKSLQNTEMNKALEEANARIIKANSEYNATESKLIILQGEIENAKRESAASAGTFAWRIEAEQKELGELKKKREELLRKWNEEEEQDYQSSAQKLICPLLGMECDSSTARTQHHNNDVKARNAFEERKVLNLERIEAEGLRIKKEIIERENNINAVRAEQNEAAAKHADKLAELRSKETELISQLNGMTKQAPINAIDVSTLPGWQQQQAEIDQLKATINEMKAATNPGEGAQSTRKTEIRKRLDEIASELGKEAIIERNQKRVAQLEEESSKVAQQMAELEREQETLRDLEKALIDEVEARANAKFNLVKFRTCDWQINGEPVQTCYATLNGVKYSDLNSAGQVNAGLDIINTLCREYNVNAPIFIDNAEGVNTLLATASQMIQLRVTEEKSLQVTINEE